MINKRPKYKAPGLPESKGLYNPQNEHDGCGVGMVINIKNKPSYEIVSKGLAMLCNLEHRGAVGADPKAGDGSGLLIQIPHKFLKKKIEEMKEHEKEHYEFFDQEIKKRNIKPTKLLPLWDLMGVTLGFGTAMLGEKAAMLCTASVEEVIDGHYKDQTYKLGEDEKELKEKIMKFREDELHHKDIAYNEGATKDGPYSILDKIIKVGSRIAINISEKI